MEKKFPLISIVTPSYNQGQFLEKTILSVVNQKYPKIEYIIIDGGSTDNSVDIIKQYKSKISYWTSEPDKGQSNALNKGFAKANGDILAWINSDDWYEPDIFKNVASCFQKRNLDVLVGNCVVIDDNNSKSSVVRPQNVTFNSMLRYWESYFCPPQPSIFFSKRILNKVGNLDETLEYAMDLDLWLRMAKTTNFHYINKNVANYLIHPASKSGLSNDFVAFSNEWKAVCKKNLKQAGLISKFSFYSSLFKSRIRRSN